MHAEFAKLHSNNGEAMPHRTKPLTIRRVWPAILALSVIITTLPNPALSNEVQSENTPKQVTRATMQGLFSNLSSALRYSLNDDQFGDPALRKNILRDLRALAASAEQLQLHGGKSLNTSFHHLRDRLALDARELLTQFEAGENDRARFILHEMTDNCVACHSKLPSKRAFPLGKAFQEEIDPKKLDLAELVRLQVATRQFGAALDSYETIFRSKELTPTQIDLVGFVKGYLKIAIRVRGEYQRAARTLEQFRNRPDMHRYLQNHIAYWITALRELDPKPKEESLLQQARTVVQEAQKSAQFPLDRYGLIHYYHASSLLFQFLDTQTNNKKDLAEAFYLLGIAEAHLTHGYWVSETEFYLEQSIRSDPNSPYAEKAYAFLEEYVITGFSGSAGTDIPEDMQALLNELKQLISNS